MRALVYLSLRSFRNRLLQLVKKPGQLIVLLLCLGMIGFVLFTPRMEGVQGGTRPIGELYAIALGLYAFLTVAIARQGLENGATFFNMSDVNLSFTSPISPTHILLHGLASQLGTALFAGFFLLFQYSWLYQAYGIGLGTLLAILLGYALCMFVAQLVALCLYAFSSASPRRRALVRLWFYAILGLSAAVLVAIYLQAQGSPLERLVLAATSTPAYLLPIFGWVLALVKGLIASSPSLLLFGVGLTGLVCALLILFLSRSGSDFYEDVLSATELRFSQALAQKEGKAANTAPKKVRTGKLGLDRGHGASAIFHKHLLEDRRQGVLLLDGLSLLMGILAIGFAFFTRDSMEGAALPVCFAFACYLQIFSSFTGRWLREFNVHYVYLIPEPPFRKLLGMLSEHVLKLALDAVVVMALFGLCLSATPAQTAALVLARFGFGLLLMAASLLSERLLSEIKMRWLIIMLHFLFMLLLCAPGIVLAVVVAFFTPAALGMALAFLAFAGWCALCALTVLFCCRNLLQHAELKNP